MIDAVSTWSAKTCSDLSNTSRDGNALSVNQHGKMMIAGSGLNLLDPIQMDDGRAAHAKKLFHWKFGFQSRHRLPQKMVLSSDVQDRVVSVGVDPVNLLRRDEGCALATPDTEPARTSSCIGWGRGEGSRWFCSAEIIPHSFERFR